MEMPFNASFLIQQMQQADFAITQEICGKIVDFSNRHANDLAAFKEELETLKTAYNADIPFSRPTAALIGGIIAGELSGLELKAALGEEGCIALAAKGEKVIFTPSVPQSRDISR